MNYKILNNVLYQNRKVHAFGLGNAQLCSFRKIEDETISHLFYYCTHIQDIWNHVQSDLTDCLHFLQLTQQTAIFFVFQNIDNNTFLTQNHILLLLKLQMWYISNLCGKSYFTWKTLSGQFKKKYESDSSNFVLLNHQMLKNNGTLEIGKMSSNEIYSIITLSKVNIPTSRIYLEKKIPLYIFQLKDIYTLPRKVIINAYLRLFQQSIRNKILHQNKKVHTFGL